ncbi:MAG TPA: hypothetical protein VGO11_19955 [Chthoniobacteraceae bacterium]|jgi:hypothetical protein|nr:hypothetical protein [Chthoniobacteraceae bacterium]
MKQLLIRICTIFALVLSAGAEEPPAQPLGSKGTLILSDDFSTDRFGTVWSEHIATAGVENGVMFGRQTGAAHGSVVLTKLDLPDGNLICECKVQWEHNVTVAFSFDDMKFRGSVAGHIARVTLEQQLVKLHDDKEGSMNNDLIALRKSDDAEKKAAAEAAMKLHTLQVPMTLEKSHWYLLGIEIVGDQMRVTIDGKPIGLLKSAGLTDATKSDFKLSVSGKQALFDDLKVWSVAAH